MIFFYFLVLFCLFVFTEEPKLVVYKSRSNSSGVVVKIRIQTKDHNIICEILKQLVITLKLMNKQESQRKTMLVALGR